jgi:hypothetical protein
LYAVLVGVAIGLVIGLAAIYGLRRLADGAYRCSSDVGFVMMLSAMQLPSRTPRRPGGRHRRPVRDIGPASAHR